MNRPAAAFAALCVMSLAGCMSVEPPQLPKGDVPVDWNAPVNAAAQVWPDTDWWTHFGSDELTSLIGEVKADNLDLANNRRNLRAAQISLRDAGFSLWPTPALTLGTSTSRSRSRVDGKSNSDRSTGPFQLTGSLSYNGIFSKPASYDQAQASYQSRVAQTADLALNTLGTAASTYFQVLFIRDQIKAARQNLDNAETIGKIADARVKAGVAVPIEALQQQIAIERQRTNLKNLQQSDLEARASLALLLGRGVQGFEVKGQTLADIQVPSVRPGLPAGLLERRPDLVEARAAVVGASANVNVVRTSFLPQISLTSSTSAASSALMDVVSAPDTALNLGASLMQTLLGNGQRVRNIEQANLSAKSAMSSYRKAVLAAFNDVDVQLNNIQVLKDQAAVAQRNLDAAEEAFRIAESRYQTGVGDYQTVLTSQNTLFSTRIDLLQSKLQRLNAMIAFYEALGGGWTATSDAALASPPKS